MPPPADENDCRFHGKTLPVKAGDADAFFLVELNRGRMVRLGGNAQGSHGLFGQNRSQRGVLFEDMRVFIYHSQDFGHHAIRHADVGGESQRLD